MAEGNLRDVMSRLGSEEPRRAATDTCNLSAGFL